MRGAESSRHRWLRVLLTLLPRPNGHRLLLSLAACDADPLRAARFTNGKHNREDPILKLRLDIIGIDRSREGDRPFKRAGDDFPREPVVSLPMATPPPLLSLLLGLGLGFGADLVEPAAAVPGLEVGSGARSAG